MINFGASNPYQFQPPTGGGKGLFTGVELGSPKTPGGGPQALVSPQGGSAADRDWADFAGRFEGGPKGTGNVAPQLFDNNNFVMLA